MVDAHALGACGCGRAGSNPASPTMQEGFCTAKVRKQNLTGARLASWLLVLNSGGCQLCDLMIFHLMFDDEWGDAELFG